MIEERPDIIAGYQVVIGLEVHAQLTTASKAYSGDRNAYGDMPNTNTAPLTLGHPGTLPRMNSLTVEHAIKIGLATHCRITSEMHFARKNYFYADLPKGYQITQDTTPICTNGYVDITMEDGQSKRIGITRIHMEEDAGKSIHDQDPESSLIDLNRAGVPLVEIVSEPDMRSSDEAYRYLAEIRRLVRHLEICDGNMEEGSLRCDANVSVMPKGSETFGNRCEVKNMNSLRNVQRAIEYEMKRQIALLEAGETSIAQETRNFDAVRGITFALRGKEDAHDYRYFPEPDLPPLRLSSQRIDDIKAAMPPLPAELLEKYQKDYGLSAYDADILVDDKHTALYYNDLINHTSNYKAAANWVIGEVKSYLNQTATDISQFPLRPEQIAAVIAMIDADKISHSSASQTLFPLLVQNPESDPETLAAREELLQQSDDARLETWAREAIAAFPDKAEDYRKGNKGLLGLFMGEVMKRSQRRANPKKASEILKNLLEK